jgi:KaiC/GvpD/RAD55 family RecA-like ATPase
MLESQILGAAIADRSAYDKIERHISHKEFTPQTGFWWKVLAEYYKRDSNADSADRAVLVQLGESRITNPKHRDGILAALPENCDRISVPNVVSAALGLLRTNRAAEFASAAISGDTNKATALLETINDLYSKEEFEEESEVIEASPIEAIFDKVGTDKRIPVLPAALNTRIGGGVLPGHHVLVFGRTEAGKSAFVINLCAGFIKQKQRVLFIGNEDEINVVKARFLCRIVGKTMQEVEADKEGSIALYKQRGAEDLLKLIHMAPGTIEAIDRACEEFKPNVVVLDQIRNLGSDEDGITRKIESNAIRFRGLLNKHNMVGISVTQASDKSDRNSADLPVWLSAGDVDSSRVGLPGTVDLMLGIAGNNEMISRGQRTISMCKNKLHSGPQSREGFVIQLDTARNIAT